MALPEFLNLSPRQFKALQDCHLANQQAEDYRAGIQIATIVNMFGGEKAKDIDASFFFSSLKTNRNKKKQSIEDLELFFKTIANKREDGE